MRMNDPSRPRINGLPSYSTGLGRAIVPSLTVFPVAENRSRVSVMLAVEDNSFQWFSAILDTDRLPSLLADYRKDPEHFLHVVFGYKVKEA